MHINRKKKKIKRRTSHLIVDNFRNILFTNGKCINIADMSEIAGNVDKIKNLRKYIQDTCFSAGPATYSAVCEKMESLYLVKKNVLKLIAFKCHEYYL